MDSGLTWFTGITDMIDSCFSFPKDPFTHGSEGMHTLDVGRVESSHPEERDRD